MSHRDFLLTRRALLMGGAGSVLVLARPDLLFAAETVTVEPQPYFAHIQRLLDAMRLQGEPVIPADEKTLLQMAAAPSREAVAAAEAILAKYTLFRVSLDRNGIGRTTQGSAPATLVEQGWRSFLIRVENPFALQQEIMFSGDNAFAESGPQNHGSTSQIAGLTHYGSYGGPWLGYQFATKPPMSATLSGLGIEYRIVQFYSRDRGVKKAYMMFHGDDHSRYGDARSASRLRDYFEGAHSGFQATFECLASRDIALNIKDWDGTGCMASLLVTDKLNHVYPPFGGRIAPDFDFQAQVYRGDGETLRLPDGDYTAEFWRGPEYIRKSQPLTISAAMAQIDIRLERWINAAALGWYPGDTHIHAAGCSHYERPTQGVTPETMIRHVRGEALAVGDVLTWGPGWYHQKQFFSGHVYAPKNVLEYPEMQEARNVTLRPAATPRDKDSMIRYDIEVSGFPSSHSGHLVLLRLAGQDYPGAQALEEWPSWNLPILKWAKAQGAVCGFAHCGYGMAVASEELPNYDIPPFTSIGTNEFIVDITHDAVDFLSGAELLPSTELNAWYHTLNCGFRATMVGETDFPCVSDQRVGRGRTYVGLDQTPADDAGYAAWVEGIKNGRLYYGDGRSHFIDYRINGRGVGQNIGKADVKLARPGRVKLRTRLAARLEETAPNLADLYMWHLEHARIGDTRNVPVEVIVNGRPVARKAILADGELRDFSIDVEIEQSSWVALRILPSGHTHPIFVEVADKPVRASKRSAQWCLDCIDALWQVKSPHIRPPERMEAKEAYDHARAVYQKILAECGAD